MSNMSNMSAMSTASTAVGSSRPVRVLAWASLVANIGIVVTGGAVRLTSSGLGCPTWPRCTEDSFVPTAEFAEHGVIEFGNRLLTFVLAAIAIALLVATIRDRVRPSARGRREMRLWALVLFLGIPAQAVLGGITVLTGLNPYSVMGHFLLSTVIIAAATVTVRRSTEHDGPRRSLVARPIELAGYLLLGLAATVVVLGTVVTGTGPHAGDSSAVRTGFDPVMVTQLHADAVLLTVGLTIGLIVALTATRAPRSTVRAMVALLVVEGAQGLIGYVQYFSGVPAVLVASHLLGACLFVVFAVRAVLAQRVRLPSDYLLAPAGAVRDERGAGAGGATAGAGAGRSTSPERHA